MPGSAQKYVIYSNVLIEAHRRYYSLDIAPAFWDFLIDTAENGIIQSIDRVYDEILKGNDDLAGWVKNSFPFAFVNTKNDSDVLNNYGKLINWAYKHSQFNQAAKDEFTRVENADPWIISYAMYNGFVVETQEVLDKNVMKNIPIPNVCVAFNVKYINTFTLLRELNFKFN